MSRRENTFFFTGVFIVSILLVISQLVLYSKGFYSLSADGAGHTLEAYQWYKGQATIFSIWLPFQKVFYGLIFNVYYNLFWVPRILSSFFGLLTLLSLMFLTYELFQNKIITFLAGFLASIFSCVVIFSVIPMPEIYCFFFVITSIAFLLHWKRTKHLISLLLTIIFTCLGTTIRYEAWVFSAVIFLVIVIDIYSSEGKLRHKFFKSFGILLLLSAFPIYWMYLSYSTSGEFTSFISSVVERYSPGGIIAEIKNNILYNFLVINLFSLNILGLLTLLSFNKKGPQIKTFAAIFFITLLGMSLITYFTKAMPTHHPWRLASIWSIMLIPFTAQWLYIIERLFLKYNFILFAIILCLFFNLQTANYSNFSFMKKEDLIIGKYINRSLKFKDPNSKIYIEGNAWYYTSLLVTSQQPDKFITINNNNIYSAFANSKQAINYNTANIEYLILRRYTELNIDTTRLREIKKYDNWIIYKFH
jgi:hypothetical protein